MKGKSAKFITSVSFFGMSSRIKAERFIRAGSSLFFYTDAKFVLSIDTLNFLTSFYTDLFLFNTKSFSRAFLFNVSTQT